MLSVLFVVAEHWHDGARQKCFPLKRDATRYAINIAPQERRLPVIIGTFINSHENAAATGSDSRNDS